MKQTYHLLSLLALLLIVAEASAQQAAAPIIPGDPGVPTEATVGSEKSLSSLHGSSAPPLTLRDGAVSTGLGGFYDYQSNGMSPAWLRVDPEDPEHLHAVYMLSTDGTNRALASSTRRVGYAESTDGGQTWNANSDITDIDFRLGFPYLQIGPQGSPFIAAHGDVDGQGVRTILFAQLGGGDNFTRLTEMPRRTASNRDGEEGAGTIWPAYAFSDLSQNEPIIQLFSSLSNRQTEGAAPLQIAAVNFTEEATWRDFGDSSVTATSGGRYVVARSGGGKVGVVYLHFDAAVDLAGVYFSETVDGGESWSPPLRIIDRVSYTDEFLLSGDQDTLVAGLNLDLVYMGEEAHVVCDGRYSGRYAYEGIFHWSPTTDLQRLFLAKDEPEIGLWTAALLYSQPNMNYVAYPTLAAGEDDDRLVVAFMAAYQEDESAPQAASPDGFYYYRLWGMASKNGGLSWGRPFLIQDFAGTDSDSASIEYPAADEVLRAVDGGHEFSLTFQARRYPGMYSFISSNLDGDPATNDSAARGPITECYQYFQRMTLDESHFSGPQVSVQQTSPAAEEPRIHLYPNPTAGRTRIDYSVAEPGTVSITIIDALGREVLRPIQAEHDYSGTYSGLLDLDVLPAGMYRCVLAARGTRISVPVEVLR